MNKENNKHIASVSVPNTIVTEIIPIDYEDQEIGKTIIRNYHAQLKSLIDSNLSYQDTMDKVNSYMYYIKDNIYVLDKDIADGTIKACNNIIEHIEERFKTIPEGPVKEVQKAEEIKKEVKETEVSSTKVPLYNKYTQKDLDVISTLKSLVKDNTAVSVKLANFQWYKSFLQTKNNEEIESVCNNIYQNILLLKTIPNNITIENN
jgi:hypothetical protein